MPIDETAKLRETVHQLEITVTKLDATVKALTEDVAALSKWWDRLLVIVLGTVVAALLALVIVGGANIQ